jgi:hypothetical protein
MAIIPRSTIPILLRSGFSSRDSSPSRVIQEILSTRLPSIETNGSPLSALQSMAFPCLIAVVGNDVAVRMSGELHAT